MKDDLTYRMFTLVTYFLIQHKCQSLTS